MNQRYPRSMTMLELARHPATTERQLYEITDWVEWCYENFRNMTKYERAGLVNLCSIVRRRIEAIAFKDSRNG